MPKLHDPHDNRASTAATIASEIAWGTLGEGAPLVLPHGTPFSSQVRRRIAPWLARYRRVFFYDLLSYGQSAKPDADMSLGMQNRLLPAMLRAWQLDWTEVVAHDFSGTIALRAHFLDGISYAALTLIDPVAIAPQGSPFAVHVGRHEAAFIGLPAYAHRALISAYIQNAAARPLTEEALFVDRGRGVGRRWCVMRTCGNRAKAEAFRER